MPKLSSTKYWKLETETEERRSLAIFDRGSFIFFKNDEIAVVAQYYDTDVNKEYAIRGNSAILKCVVPSFVADFVKVLSWHTDQGEEFVPGDDYGSPRVIRSNLTFKPVVSSFFRADLPLSLYVAKPI